MIICFFLIINVVHNVHPLLALYGIVLDFLHLPPKIILFQYFNIFKLLKQSCTVSFPCWITISVISLLHKSKYFSNDTCKTFFEWSGVLSFANQSKLILKPWNQQMGFLHIGTMHCGSACLGLFFFFLIEIFSPGAYLLHRSLIKHFIPVIKLHLHALRWWNIPLNCLCVGWCVFKHQL